MTAISVVGAGYVGLVTGLGLAQQGHAVLCVDVDEAKLAAISSGTLPFYEPGLQQLLDRHLGDRFTLTDDLDRAVARSSVTFVTVGTPSGPDGIDLRFVVDVARGIGNALPGKAGEWHTVVIKSTVVPGTTDGVVREAIENASGLVAGADFSVAANPEFLTEGQAIADFFEPDRIVLGVEDRRGEKDLREIYASFESTPLLITNARTAEMIKYASNALLATMISFSNELANLGAAIGDIDTVDVMRGVHMSRYLTSSTPTGDVKSEITSFLEAGCGFGGSCLPKDVSALGRLAESVETGHALLDAVLTINQDQPLVLVDLAEQAVGDLEGLSVAVLGLAFKPDTSDTRETPALPVIAELHGRGASVIVHDPIVRLSDLPPSARASAIEEADLESAIERSDVVILVTRWSEFERVPEIIRSRESPPVLVDGRRVIEPSTVPHYLGIGR